MFMLIVGMWYNKSEQAMRMGLVPVHPPASEQSYYLNWSVFILIMYKAYGIAAQATSRFSLH